MSDVPRSDLYDDVYFSAEDGAAETHHVFLDGNDLPRRWQGPAHTIAETGFGTGLNFLLTWEMFEKTAPPGAFLDFISVEKHPLSTSQIRTALAPWTDRLSSYLDQLLAQYPLRVPGFHRLVFNGRVALTLIFDDVNTALPRIEGQVDSWFLDGFTPAKNPDMWTQTLFDEMARLSHGQTTFSTFTAAGFVRRGLQAAGFQADKKPGYGSKRDMLAGCYRGEEKKALQAPPRTVGIVGAGLAGTACASILRQYGFSPVLYDDQGIATGASGNALGIVGLRPAGLRTPQSDFYASAYAAALNHYQQFDDVAFDVRGGLHLAVNDDKHRRLSQMMAQGGWHADHLQWLDVKSASDAAGISLGCPALYLPDKASLSPARLCCAMAEDTPLIRENITHPDKVPCDAVILANGADAGRITGLPLQTVRGQITQIEATPSSSKIKTNLHYGGYISAPCAGHHYVGATFQRWLNHTDILQDDDADNLARLQQSIPALAGDYRIIGARAALRCTAKDYFPIIGALNERLLISTAHGSHGLASAVAGAHLLADYLRGGIRSQPRDTVAALSAHRFLP